MAFNVNKLKARMVEKGITGQTLAKLMNLSEATIYDKLNNKIEFKRSEIERLCELLTIPAENIVDYFFS